MLSELKAALAALFEIENETLTAQCKAGTLVILSNVLDDYRNCTSGEEAIGTKMQCDAAQIIASEVASYLDDFLERTCEAINKVRLLLNDENMSVERHN